MGEFADMEADHAESDAIRVEQKSEAKSKIASPLTFKVRNYIDAKQLERDLSYSLTDLSKAMIEQGALFIHYSRLMAKASRQVDDVSMLLEITEGKVYRKLRDEAVRSGAKLTEALLEKAVSLHQQVVQMKRAKNEARQIETNAKAAVEAFRQRRDMLIQEGATQRAEIERGHASINARNERGQAAAQAQARLRARMEETRASASDEV